MPTMNIGLEPHGIIVHDKHNQVWLEPLFDSLIIFLENYLVQKVFVSEFKNWGDKTVTFHKNIYNGLTIFDNYGGNVSKVDLDEQEIKTLLGMLKAYKDSSETEIMSGKKINTILEVTRKC